MQVTLQNTSIMYNFDTQTGCLGAPGCANTSTVNLSTVLAATWPDGGNTAHISAYNGTDTFIYTDPASQRQFRVFGEGSNFGSPTSRAYVTLSGTAVGALSGLWWVPVLSPGSPVLYPPGQGTTAAPPDFLNPAAGGVAPLFASAACHNATLTGKCSAQVSTRTAICSPFLEDGATAANGYCGQVIFMGGVDMQGNPPPNGVSNVAWELRLPVGPSVVPP